MSYISFTEKEDIEVEVTASANGSDMHVNYDFVVVDNRA